MRVSVEQINRRTRRYIEAKIDERGIYTWRITTPYKEGLVTIRAQIIIPS